MQQTQQYRDGDDVESDATEMCVARLPAKEPSMALTAEGLGAIYTVDQERFSRRTVLNVSLHSSSCFPQGKTPDSL